ncbi:hypothetical protein [Nostoc sp. ChiQUE01b]|uniref:hypothetical protein n=1 Tax=Nostoc sp. ChiQUE01b TaxID=3075376 RepID=UPI002AD2341D|nr:hypothetical protein [Nostoc sp. ChiQUE01b]
MYLLLEKNRAMPAAGYAYACYTKALEFRNGKCFRRVTEASQEAMSDDKPQASTHSQWM